MSILSGEQMTGGYGGTDILHECTIGVEAGEIAVIVGPNGAGKSTLLRVILSEEELDAGDVVKSRKLQVGYLRQNDPFHPGESALEYLIRDSGQPDWKCGEIAGQFELKGDALLCPITELSGGWQTRVKLASLLLHEPNLLLLE
mgnify:CR=1 FL=1